MITGNALPYHWQQIDWQHIHGVHQENPDKQGQTQRCNSFTRLFVMDNALTHVIHEFEQNFNSRLKTTGHASRRFFGATPQKEAADYAQQNGKKDCIKVNERKISDVFQSLTLSNIRHTGQALQVVLDVVGSGHSFTCHSVSLSTILKKPND
jgi:hypothetical protein